MQPIHELGFLLLQQPFFLPDLVPSDYHGFPQLKINVKSCNFSSNEEVIEFVEAWFAEQDTFFLGVAGLF